MFTKDKDSSLLRKSTNYGPKRSINLGPGVCDKCDIFVKKNLQSLPHKNLFGIILLMLLGKLGRCINVTIIFVSYEKI
jgi:hypothetical protein